MEQLRRTGVWHMDLCAQEVAAGLAAAGRRSGRRRHPVRAQARRDTRPATRATLQAQVATQNPSLPDQPRANAQGALQQLVAKAAKRRLADGVALPVEARSLTLALHEDAQTDAATLAGCDVLNTALTPQHAPKARVQDRDTALASVAQACRTCQTAHRAGRPSVVRRAARTRAQACVVMRASPIIHSLPACWRPVERTVAEGRHALTTLGLVAGAPQHAASSPCLPTPRDAIARLLHSADITLPKAFSLSGTRVSTKKKRPSERLVQ
jgi:hypothetical protein